MDMIGFPDMYIATFKVQRSPVQRQRRVEVTHDWFTVYCKLFLVENFRVFHSFTIAKLLQ